MKFRFSVKKSRCPAGGQASGPSKMPAIPGDGKKQILTGLVFVSAAFLGAVFLFLSDGHGPKRQGSPG